MSVRFDSIAGEKLAWAGGLAQPTGWSGSERETTPGSVAPIVIADAGKYVLEPAQWGLTPQWAKEAEFGQTNAFNARAETLLERPTFRSCIKSKRCVIPATAFYEWVDGRWLRFERADGAVMALAGLYETETRHCDWLTFAVITVAAKGDVKRLPVVMGELQVDIWLDRMRNQAEVLELLKACPSDWLAVEEA